MDSDRSERDKGKRSPLTTKDAKTDDLEYRSLFWLPKLLQTAKDSEVVLNEMIDMIDHFYDDDAADEDGPGVEFDDEVEVGARREQILGEMDDLEELTTTVEVVPKPDETKYTILGILKSHFLFRQLQDYELEDVIDAMQFEDVDQGEDIITEGEEGDKFYVVEEGECVIIIDGKEVGPMMDGCFGDLALMYNSPRSATIHAVTDCNLWTLDRVFFRRAMVNSSSKQHDAITKFLGTLPLFQDVGMENRAKMACSFTRMIYQDGDYIIRQGEIGEHFYVLYSGEVNCTKTLEDGSEIDLIKLEAGQIFGERALIKQEPRGANVIAVGETECLTMSKVDFKIMMQDVVDQMNEINEFRILRSAPMFMLLSDNQLKTLSDTFERKVLFKGQKILCDPEILFMVIDGKLVNPATETTYGMSKIVGTVENGSGFTGSLTCEGNEAAYRAIDRKFLINALNAIEEDGLHVKSSQEQPLPKTKKEKKPVKRVVVRGEGKLGPFGDVALSDLSIEKALGKGTFGHVYKAKHKETGMSLALKCLDIKNVYKYKQVPYIIREAHALQSFQHPFVSDYYGATMSNTRIFFLLELVTHGELWHFLYQNKNRETGQAGGLPMHTVAFYASIILLALEHMHDQRVAYRDLKPENLLISSTGYLKLVDFGFCKTIPFISKSGTKQYRTYTLCGTPDYIAPEVILTQGHDKGVDFWSYGVIIYEMMSLKTPFAANSQKRIFEKIVHSHKHLSFPQFFDAHAKSLIRRLLHPNPGLRFGNTKEGATGVKGHAFFLGNNANLEEIGKMVAEAPYIPKNEDLVDVTGVDLLDLNMEVEYDGVSHPDFKNLILNPLTMDEEDDDFDEDNGD